MSMELGHAQAFLSSGPSSYTSVTILPDGVRGHEIVIITTKNGEAIAEEVRLSGVVAQAIIAKVVSLHEQGLLVT